MRRDGKILTVDEGTNVVYYAYKCRSGMLEVSFKLDVAGTGGSTGGGSTGGGSTGGTVPPVTLPPAAVLLVAALPAAVTAEQASRCWLLAA